MMIKSQVLAAAVLVACSAAAQADDNEVKFGVTRYTTHSKTNGISGPGVPAGADAETGDATTVLFTYERFVAPNWGLSLDLGIPPRIKAKATGSVAFLGEVLSAKNVAPTAFVNYHFFESAATLRPYLGLGINYTRFVDIKSSLASDVKMSDSVGWAAVVGLDYAINDQWGLWTSVAALKVKTKVVAVTPGTVLTSTIDFRPIVYSAGASFRF